MQNSKKYILYFIILLCISILIPHFNHSANTGDWLMFIILEMSIQLLISNKQ